MEVAIVLIPGHIVKSVILVILEVCLALKMQAKHAIVKKNKKKQLGVT